jgi:hypothetical protein
MDAEQRAVEAMVEEIAHLFPECSRQQVRQVVVDHWAHFADAPVRDYLPMLIRLRVISELRASA